MRLRRRFPDLLPAHPVAAGALRIRAGAAQIYLLADSAAILADAAPGLSAQVVRGALGFSSSGTERIEVRASDAVIRPKNAQPVHGQVSLINSDELVVTSYRGSLEIVVGDQLVTLTEASSFRVVLEPEPQGPEGADKEKARHRRAMFFWLTVAVIAAGTGIGVWRATVSPDHP